MPSIHMVPQALAEIFLQFNPTPQKKRRRRRRGKQYKNNSSTAQDLTYSCCSSLRCMCLILSAFQLFLSSCQLSPHPHNPKSPRKPSKKANIYFDSEALTYFSIASAATILTSYPRLRPFISSTTNRFIPNLARLAQIVTLGLNPQIKDFFWSQGARILCALISSVRHIL